MIPALALLHQTVEPVVRNWGKTKKVKLLDQEDNVVDQLKEGVTSGEFEVFSGPTAAEIEAVVEFLRPEPEAAVAAGAAAPAAAPPPSATAAEPATRQVVIQHVDTVNVFISGDAAAVSRLELPDSG